MVRLLEVTESGGFGPVNATEWLPFIEAYLHLGDELQATHLLAMAGDAPAQYQDAIRARLEDVATQAQDRGTWTWQI